jgi:hypothetical protein
MVDSGSFTYLSAYIYIDQHVKELVCVLWKHIYEKGIG